MAWVAGACAGVEEVCLDAVCACVQGGAVFAGGDAQEAGCCVVVVELWAGRDAELGQGGGVCEGGGEKVEAGLAELAGCCVAALFAI